MKRNSVERSDRPARHGSRVQQPRVILDVVIREGVVLDGCILGQHDRALEGGVAELCGRAQGDEVRGVNVGDAVWHSGSDGLRKHTVARTR